MGDDLEKLQEQLKASKINEVLNRLKVSGTEKFFEGLPDLKAGYAIYMQRRAVRAKVGAGLAPGGCFILGHSAILAGCLAEAHTMLARMLRLPAEHIHMNIERPGTRTGIRLTADVAVPDGYMTPVHGEEDPKKQKAEIGKLTEQYLSACIEEVNPIFRRNLLERLDALGVAREDLSQGVIPMRSDDEEEETEGDDHSA